MDNKHLQRLVDRLHRELASAESVDDDARASLQRLVRDVEKLAGDDDSRSVEPESTADQLNRAALRFESEHPKLSMALGEVIDALGKLGI